MGPQRSLAWGWHTADLQHNAYGVAQPHPDPDIDLAHVSAVILPAQRVGLDGTQQTWSVFGTDTLALGAAWHATASARVNVSTIDNRDRIDPGGGGTSLRAA